MKKNTKKVSLMLAGMMLMGTLTGCVNTAEEKKPEVEGEQGQAADTFEYSAGLTPEGLWEGVNALEYITLGEYNGISLAKDVYTVENAAVEEQIAQYAAAFTTTNNVEDRAVVDGDTVNIDYVGSVDGVEFEGGTTQGAGTSVTIGVTVYIDDFLQQIIGHMPGETFDVNVTFPEDYQEESLQGKDALFVTTVNHIEEEVVPEITDAFVAENLQEQTGWTTVAQMEEETRKELEQTAIQVYVQEHLLEICSASEIPESVFNHKQESMIDFYKSTASYYQMDYETYLMYMLGAESEEAMLESTKEEVTAGATMSLIFQAIAEQEGLSVDEADLKAYFLKNMGSEDYSQFITYYGENYINMTVLQDKALNFVVDGAIREE